MGKEAEQKFFHPLDCLSDSVRTWRGYEEAIYKECERVYYGWVVKKNVHLLGRHSKVKRQIDVFVYKNEEQLDKTAIVFEGKYYNKKVDVKGVEEFLSMLNDLNVSYGVLVTTKGYSKAALNRAQYGDERAEADILTLRDLTGFQSQLAIPYSGGFAAIVPAPFGWVIDGRKTQFSSAVLYPRGCKSVEDNPDSWMYIQFYQKGDEIRDMRDMVDYQIATSLKYQPDVRQAIVESREDGIVEVSATMGKDIREITIYEEFDNGFFSIVLLCHENIETRCRRKLYYVAENSLLLGPDGSQMTRLDPVAI